MSYSALLRDHRVRSWAFATAGSRLAVTTVPLGCVLLAAWKLNSFAFGGFLAASYALGEALFAPVMSSRLREMNLVREVSRALVAEACFLVSAVGLLHIAPVVWLALPAMAAAGGVAAGVPGGLRAYIATVTDDGARIRALSLDTILNQMSWLAGPAVAAGLAALLDPSVTLIFVACLLILTLLAVRRLLVGSSEVGFTGRQPSRLLMRTLIVPVFASGVIMLTVAALDVLLPAFLAKAGQPPALAGALLGCIALLSIGCSVVYTSRKWPGSPATHSQLAVMTMGVLLIATGLSHELWLGLLLCGLIGAAQAPALLGRNIALTRALAQPDWPLGFSLMYSAGGVGYTIGGSGAGVLSEKVSVAGAFVAVGATILGSTLVITAIPFFRQWLRRRTG